MVLDLFNITMSAKYKLKKKLFKEIFLITKKYYTFKQVLAISQKNTEIFQKI